MSEQQETAPQAAQQVNAQEDATLGEVCQTLSNCQEPEEAIKWIDVLELLLLQDNEIDPAETFLAIQHLAHRLEESDKLRQNLRLGLLWAAATLARVCVGPAWWHQIQERRVVRSTRVVTAATAPLSRIHSEVHNESSTTTWIGAPMDVVHADVSRRSCSPMTPPMPFEISSMPRTSTLIPEALPAMMLRFAVDMNPTDPSASSIQGQIMLASSLCCPLTSDQGNHWRGETHWTIVGAEDALRALVLTWLDQMVKLTMEQGPQDRASSFSLVHCIVRALTDVLAAGWRPNPVSTREVIVDQLVECACQACAFLQRVSSHDPTANEEESVALTAMAIIAEVLAALYSLASSEFIPVSRLKSTVVALCALKIDLESGEVDENLLKARALPSEEQSPLELLRTQRDACQGDISGLLWILLVRESSSVPVIDSLLEILSAPVRILSNEAATADLPKSWGQAIQASGVAARAVSVAVWGNPPQTMIVPSLRIYWQTTLSALSQLLACMLAKRLRVLQSAEGDNSLSSEELCDIYQLARVCFMCLNMAIEKEVRGGKGSLSNSEWDILVICLKENVLPWLGAAVDKHTVCVAQSIFWAMGNFLDKCVAFDTASFADFHLQRKLYDLLLKDVTPLLPQDMSISIGSTTMKCWTKFGLFPHKLEEWCGTVSAILEEAFRRNDDGTYAHHSCVRLEALRVLETEGENDPQDTLHSSADEVAGGDRCTSFPPLLVLTQHLREQYLKLISASVIPAVKDILCNPSPQPGDSSTHATDATGTLFVQDKLNNAKNVLCGGIIFSEQDHPNALELFAVRLVGGLYRGASGDRDHRTLFISILQSVARNLALQGETVGTSSLEHHSHSVYVRSAAARELARCLEACFTVLPHSHECVPTILKAMCALLQDFTTGLTAGKDKCKDLSERAVLGICAVEAISRLRITPGQRVVIYPDSCASSSTHEFVLHFLQNHAYGDPLARNPDAIPQGTPFLTTAANKSATEVDFTFVESATIQFLVISADPCLDCHEAVKSATVCVRVACFDLLRTLALEAYIILPRDAAADVFVVHQSTSVADNIAMGFALSQHVQTTLLADTRDEDNAHAFALIRLFFDQCIQLLYNSCAHAGILVSVPFILSASQRMQTRSSSSLTTDMFCILEQMLKTEASVDSGRNSSREMNRPTSEALIGLVFDCLHCNEYKRIPHRTRTSWFRYLVSALAVTHVSGYASVLTLRCLVALIDLSDKSQAKDMEAMIGETAWQGNEALRTVVLTLLRKQARRTSGPSPQLESGFSFLDKHEMLAREAVNMDLFHTEMSARGGDMTASWLYGEEGVLSLRLGAAASRSRGTIEVTVRTATERRRLLVRIPGQPSLETTDLSFPTALRWDSGVARSSRVSETARPSSSIVPEKISSDRVLDKARKVMGRFSAISERASRQENKKNRKRAKPKITQKQETSADPSVRPVKDRALDTWLKTTLEASDKQPILDSIKNLLSDTLEGSSANEPQWLQPCKGLQRGLGVLDRTAVLNTHKVALIYDGCVSCNYSMADNAARLLGISQCSPTFHRFVGDMGELLPTQQLRYFSAGLDVSSSGSDGEYSLVWMDDDSKSLPATSMIVYHVSSLMPESVVNRKSHLGNDNVLVLFCDVGSESLSNLEQHSTLGHSIVGGAFGFVTIFVTPSRRGSYRVSVRVRETECSSSLRGFACDCLLLEVETPCFVRNLAMRADLACRSVVDSLNAPSNLLQRKELLLGLRRHL